MAGVDGTANAAAKVAETVAAHADDAAKAAPKARLSGTGLIGIGAGAAGVLVTVLDAWREASSKGGEFDTGSLFGPTTFTIGIGTGAMVLAETGKVAGRIGTGMRVGGAAMVLGGLLGAVHGALASRDDPLGDELRASSLVQGPARFDQQLPGVVADLEGVQVASAEVTRTDRTTANLPVYVDPASARKVETESLGEAIGYARAASQADEDDRGHAVLQARDGALWIARLEGELDQVDGRGYDEGNEHDRRFEPLISKRQPALQAIVGVETRWTFPEAMDPAAESVDPGEIPWITPDLDGDGVPGTATAEVEAEGADDHPAEGTGPGDEQPTPETDG